VGVASDLLQPSSGHGADAVRGDPDVHEWTLLRPPAKRVHPPHEPARLRVPETGDAAPGVGDREEHEPHAHLFGGLRDGFGERVRIVVRFPIRAVVDVVELGDACVACS
jgi:hypothetical protein